jgi:hypothetical protein
MYRMDKTFNFHISKEERRAIEVLRKHDINISLFLRRCLRDQAEKMNCKIDRDQETGNNGGLRYDKT